MAYRNSTKYKGVFERYSQQRIFNGKPDMCYDIRYKLDGKDIFEKIGWVSEGYSAKLADQIRSERMRTIRHGDELPKMQKKDPFFKDIMERYLVWADTNKANGRTTDNYLYRGHLKHLDDKRLNEIHPFELEHIKKISLDKGLAPATAKHILVLVSEVFNKAINWGMYSGENPVKKVKMPILENKRVRFLSFKEAHVMLSSMKQKSKSLHDVCMLSLYCGLRAGEIFNLRGHDLDFENRLIHISDPKNKYPRKVFMTSAVKEMLININPETKGDFLFKDREGEKIKSISNTFERVIGELGFNDGIDDSRQKVVFHSLRHTFGSWLALQGEPIQTIAELMGHRTLTMTQRYVHLRSDEMRKAADRLNRSFNKKRTARTKSSLEN